jgi:hypothetical protein
MPMPDVQLQGANKEITDTIYKAMSTNHISLQKFICHACKRSKITQNVLFRSCWCVGTRLPRSAPRSRRFTTTSLTLTLPASQSMTTAQASTPCRKTRQGGQCEEGKAEDAAKMKHEIVLIIKFIFYFINLGSFFASRTFN